MNIVLLGKCGSGKTSLCKNLSENFRYEKIITTTTRKPRNGEVDGVDYFFVNDEEFEKSNLILKVDFNGNKYGVDKTLLLKNKNGILIVEPSGLLELRRLPFFNFISIYVSCDEYSRYTRCVNRGDEVKSIYNRMISECNIFDSVHTDYVVCNNGNDIWKATTETLECVKESVDCSHQNFIG